MEITITAIQCDVSEAMKEYAREKVARLERFFDKTRKISVTIHAEPNNNEVELICTGGRDHVFTVHVMGTGTLQEAIDSAVDKMGKQLRRYKERVRGHKGRDKRKKLVRDIKRITQRLTKLEAEAKAAGIEIDGTNDGDDTFDEDDESVHAGVEEFESDDED